MVKKIKTCVTCGKTESDNEEEIKEILKKAHKITELNISIDEDIL